MLRVAVFTRKILNFLLLFRKLVTDSLILTFLLLFRQLVADSLILTFVLLFRQLVTDSTDSSLFINITTTGYRLPVLTLFVKSA